MLMKLLSCGYGGAESFILHKSSMILEILPGLYGSGKLPTWLVLIFITDTNSVFIVNDCLVEYIIVLILPSIDT